MDENVRLGWSNFPSFALRKKVVWKVPKQKKKKKEEKKINNLTLPDTTVLFLCKTWLWKPFWGGNHFETHLRPLLILYFQAGSLSGGLVWVTLGRWITYHSATLAAYVASWSSVFTVYKMMGYKRSVILWRMTVHCCQHITQIFFLITKAT